MPEQQNPPQPQHPSTHAMQPAVATAPPAGIAQPTLPTTEPAKPKGPPPEKYRDGFLTEHGMREVIATGGSVTWNGRHINHPSQIPAQADIDKENARQTDLQRQWANAQAGAAAVPAPPGTAQPGSAPAARK